MLFLLLACASRSQPTTPAPAPGEDGCRMPLAPSQVAVHLEGGTMLWLSVWEGELVLTDAGAQATVSAPLAFTAAIQPQLQLSAPMTFGGVLHAPAGAALDAVRWTSRAEPMYSLSGLSRGVQGHIPLGDGGAEADPEMGGLDALVVVPCAQLRHTSDPAASLRSAEVSWEGRVLAQSLPVHADPDGPPVLMVQPSVEKARLTIAEERGEQGRLAVELEDGGWLRGWVGLGALTEQPYAFSGILGSINASHFGVGSAFDFGPAAPPAETLAPAPARLLPGTTVHARPGGEVWATVSEAVEVTTVALPSAPGWAALVEVPGVAGLFTQPGPTEGQDGAALPPRSDATFHAWVRTD